MTLQTPIPAPHGAKRRSVTALIVPLLLILQVTGCASSQKMFERARQLEARGEVVEAAREYIDVLEREPEWTEARTRLKLIGPLAVDTLLARAGYAEAAANFPRAVDHLDALDRLRTASSNVGVPLDVPADYAEYRREMVDGAIAFYVDAAYRAETDGGWKDALSAYDRALEYDMPAASRRDVELKKANVHLWWAENEMDEGRFRLAYAQAEHGLGLSRDEAGLSERLAEVQDAALYHGTHIAAFLPLMSTPEWERDAPRELLTDLDAALSYDYWTSPPLFVDAIDQGEVRRRLRDMGLARRTIDRQDAVRIGRALEADFVFAGELRRYREKEDVRKEDTKRVGLRGRKADTTYVLRTIRVKLEADGRFHLSDPRTGRVVAEFDVSASDEAEYRRGSFDGDVSTLDLSAREQDYFGAHLRADAVHEAQDRLLDKLAEQIARRTFDAALDRIP